MLELTHPFMLLLLVPIAAILFFVKPRGKKKSKEQKKVANTKVLKKSPEYKTLVRKYRFGVTTIFAMIMIATVTSCVLIARPASISTEDSEVYNRDIVFCTDISYSIAELNLDVIKVLKSTVSGLKGDRFGISMFNSSSVTVSPLTEDYKYIDRQFDKISESIKCNETGASCSSLTKREFINNGTLYEAEERGGSLIGDGLVSCAQLFNTKVDSDGKPTLDESRTKIIIFSTDNELGTVGGIFSNEPGKPIYTTQEAMNYVKDKGIVVYGIGTENIKPEDESVLKAGAEKTGGKYYASKNMSVEDIISSIDSSSKSLLEGHSETKRNDHPELFAILLIVVCAAIFVIERILKL